MTIISVVNQKGGVGKTTTAVNLAAYLASFNHKVILIDMDPQGNATSGIGLKQSEIKTSVYDVLVSENYIKEAICPTAFDCLHCIPAAPNLAAAEVELVHESSREMIFKNRLSHFKEFYDYIIIDCPPSLGLLTINALTASDYCIIPVQCEYYALEGIAGLVQTVKRIQSSLNPELAIMGIVMTMFDGRTALNKQVVQNTKAFFKELVFKSVIPRNIRLTEAPSHGIPISLYNPKSKGANAYLNLAKEVMNRVNI
jgi:chromosome partitioning protein